MMTPPPNLPPMIRTDADNPFANHTMRVRVPETIARIQACTADYPKSTLIALDKLSERIRNNESISMINRLSPDYNLWLDSFEPRRGETWLNTIWFFAETFFYRKIIQYTRWWETGRDPFASIKQEEYQSEALWTLLTEALNLEGSIEQRLTRLLHLDLWGNRIDLSFAASLEHGTTVADDDLLVDDTPRAIVQLIHGQGIVHLITDNTGTELAMDLALVDTLLDGITDKVALHLKMHPTFVSDATPGDVWDFINLLVTRGERFTTLGERLKSAIHDGRLQLLPGLFWNSSRLLWELPDNLDDLFQTARLVMIKGDANYRRMVGDALWEPSTPFKDVVSYFPAPLLALRTLKSDPIVGLPQSVAEKLDTVDERWRLNGKRGVIQFAPNK
jgi:uncharacterized protein with ATP-grasp and redox domains